MSTFGTLKARIADELARSDLTAQIDRAVRTAIRFHERRRFAFNEAISSFDLVADQEYYGSADLAAIPSMILVDSLRVLDSSEYFQVRQRQWDWMEHYATGGTTTGTPTDFCLYAQMLRVYPTPDESYTAQISYVARLDDFTGDEQSNGWTTDAEELIRCQAKADLLENVIRDRESFEEAAVMRRRVEEVLRSLQKQTHGRAATGSVAAYYL